MTREGLGANEADPLTAFSSPALSIFESSTPIIFLVRATWFEADFSSPPLSPWPPWLICGCLQVGPVH